MKAIKTLYLILLLPTLLVGQNSIKATFSPAENFKWAILYKNSPNKNIFISQKEINEGTVEFLLDSTKTKGIYKLVYAAPQEEYNFDIIFNGNENIALTFNLNSGVSFQQSTGNLLLNSYLDSLASIGKEIEDYYVNKKSDSLELVSLFKKQEEAQKHYENESNSTLAFPFIKANNPYIPRHYEDSKTYINNLTNNYFKSIDFNDEVLQSSNFLISRSINYILGATPEGIDKAISYNNNIDIVFRLVNGTKSTFQKTFLHKIWQKLVNYSFIDSANYLAIKYLIPLAESEKDMALALKLTQFKNLSIGNVAPDFSWEIDESGIKKNIKLSELAVAEKYILVFWSSGCSHCLEQIPKLKTIVQSIDVTKYKVITIGLEENEDNWEKEILKYPDFIHGIMLDKWANKIVGMYDIASIPAYFLLDKDKKIIAKPESLEDLEQLFEKIK